MQCIAQRALHTEHCSLVTHTLWRDCTLQTEGRISQTWYLLVRHHQRTATESKGFGWWLWYSQKLQIIAHQSFLRTCSQLKTLGPAPKLCTLSRRTRNQMGPSEIGANTIGSEIKRKWWPDLSSSSSFSRLCQHWDRWLPQRIPGKTPSGEIHILGAVRKRPQRSGHLGDLNPLSPLSDPRHHLIRKATITLIMGLLQIIYCSEQLWTQNF